MEQYDFHGWATKNDIKCADGRTIRRDAFKENDGQTVPICWGHRHDSPFTVLGHALLVNKPEGVYAYGKFNNLEQGQAAKELVQSGDLNSLSIYAGHLKHNGADVIHGKIVEVSLVLAGANEGARIEDVMAHGDLVEDEGIIYSGELITLAHADDKKEEDKPESEEKKSEDNETVNDVINSMTEKQKTAMAAMVGLALERQNESNENDKKEESTVKHHFFDADTQEKGSFLSHADEEAIVTLAKSSSVGSLQTAIEIYSREHEELAHGFENIGELFPEYKDVKPGAPELITRDQGWVSAVMNGVHKSPFSRIRTRQMDIRDAEGNENLRGRGYNRSKNNGEKVNMGNAKLLKRTTDPQTIYIKDALHRDDVLDIVDFNVVEYQYGIMRLLLNEEVALCVTIGDGREEGDNDKISEEHVRSIWHDDDLYTIHQDVDIEKMRAELQGTNTGASFGENYIYAESIIQSFLYAREHYKGSGKLDFLCTPHLLNVMLLARDMNGRRIYSDTADLAKALNVKAIYTVEQFENKTRKTNDSKTKKLLALAVDFNDYWLGATKGGEISSFNQFDINFNLERYLLETRLSGANTRVYSAIALEEDVTG